MEDLTTDKSNSVAAGKLSADKKVMKKRELKANDKLEQTLSSQSEKRTFVYWTEAEHSRFLKAVEKGHINDFQKMSKLIKTKTVQQVIDYKTNFVRKLKESK